MKNYTEQDKQAIDWIFKNMDKMGIVEIPFGSEFRYVRQFLAKCRCPVYDAVFSQRGRVDVDYANCYEWITEWTEIV